MLTLFCDFKKLKYRFTIVLTACDTGKYFIHSTKYGQQEPHVAQKIGFSFAAPGKLENSQRLFPAALSS